MAFKTFFTNLFGGSKLDVNNVFDKVSSGIDQLNFTNEERATYNKEAADALATFTKETLSESTDRSKTRRQIALAITAIYMLMSVCCMILAFFNTEKAKLLIDVSAALSLDTAFVMVLAFFFGGYYLKLRAQKK